ncbi:MAG: 50S ribosomal protein L7/L12 [Candidatus Fischerbacteria bacterium RBG_13_37_8]|uniref:Large ribosomal subunit protein bL12 n=1 Tax=Candidatus Fischerbacteria bacterium RBG_13_37_8 TaxID=1817863 RepID=A0A1F5VAM4_9BACT|nr:MAG: 50S ribosomal protein L7/L12 [Candidatus Fischerbacteria bacterium RBG_13_37_8]
MSSLSREDVINYILGLSVLELSQFIKEIEDKTGITAAAVMAPASVAAGPAAAVDAKPAEEEKTEFDVFLTGIGDKKINVIKVLRDLTNLGLKEAKELIDNVPRVVKEGISKEEADTMKKKFEEAGATVDIK